MAGCIDVGSDRAENLAGITWLDVVGITSGSGKWAPVGATIAGTLPFPADWIRRTIRIAELGGQRMASSGDAAEQNQARGIAGRRRQRTCRGEAGAIEVEHPITEFQQFNPDQRIETLEAQGVIDRGDTSDEIVVELIIIAGTAIDGGIQISPTIQPVITTIAFELVAATATKELILAGTGHDDVITATGVGDIVAGLEIKVFTFAGSRAGVITGGATTRVVDNAGSRRGASTEVGNEDTGIEDVITGIGNANLDCVDLTGNDRCNNLQHMADAIIFDCQ